VSDKSFPFFVYLIFVTFVYLTGAYSAAFNLDRGHFGTVLFSVAALLLSSILFWKKKDKTILFTWCIGIGLIARLLQMFTLPQLSDDYFRFIWDGRLTAYGINPWQFTPSQILQLQLPNFDYSIYPKLNSPDYFSVYPLVLQVQYYLANLLFPTDIFGAVLVMRLFFLGADLLSFRWLYQLLQSKNLNPKLSLLYWLHPLVVLEGMANLHAEIWLVLFLLGIFHSIDRKQPIMAALFLTLAVATKLYPIVFIPFVFYSFASTQQLKFVGWVAFFGIVLFVPMLIPILHGKLLNSVALYFGQFEFNGSFYYVLKFIEKSFDKYAPPRIVSLLLVLPMLYALFKGTVFVKNNPKIGLPTALLWFTLIYFLCNAVVHPWYLLPLLLYGIITQRFWTLLWSILILGSYLHYDSSLKEWMPYFVFGEYALLFALIFWEEKRGVDSIEAF